FSLLKQDDTQLRTILLLELAGRPLMLRQMADIFSMDETEMSDRLAQLINFQCVNRVVTSGGEEKFVISDEARFFTRRLALKYAGIATEIKKLIANLASEKLMDYSQEEFDAALIFQDYTAQGHYVLAEDFIKEQLKQRPGSVLLNLHYA